MTAMTDLPQAARCTGRAVLTVSEIHEPQKEEILNAVPGSACPTCHRRGRMLVTRNACIWPCRRHQTRLPLLHGNHTLSPARARPQRTVA